MQEQAEDLGEVTGVILAGGRSRRMGRDKLSLPVGDGTLFEHMLAFMRGLFSRVLIAGDRPDLERPDVPCVPDAYPGSSLGGLFTGLREAQTPYIFGAAADMPYPNQALALSLLRLRAGFDVVVVQSAAGYEPLFAVYAKSCLPPMERALEEGRYSIRTLFGELNVRSVGPAELPPGWRLSLTNVNTIRDYERTLAQRKT